jgi:hypothetical protein
MSNISRGVDRVHHSAQETVTGRFPLAFSIRHKHARGGKSEWTIGELVFIFRDEPRLVLMRIMAGEIQRWVFILIVEKEIG